MRGPLIAMAPQRVAIGYRNHEEGCGDTLSVDYQLYLFIDGGLRFRKQRQI